MSIDLYKGTNLMLSQQKFKIMFNYSPNQGNVNTYDLDCSVFMLNNNKLIPSSEYFIFYNNLEDPEKSVKHSGNEKIIDIDTNKINNEIKELVFVVSIHDAVIKKQNFGQIGKMFIRIVDEKDIEIASYKLEDALSLDTSIEFCRLYNKNGIWKFDASGIGYKEDLSYFLGLYYNGLVTK